MPSRDADSEQDEVQTDQDQTDEGQTDEGQSDEGQSREDAVEQNQEFGRRASDERDRAEGNDVIETPEGEFPSDAKGFDGAPLEEILKDREERLAEENRPENTEVSNAGREFDGEKGMFTDEEGFDEAEKKYSLDET